MACLEPQLNLEVMLPSNPASHYIQINRVATCSTYSLILCIEQDNLASLSLCSSGELGKDRGWYTRMELPLAPGEPTDINHGSKDRSKSSLRSIREIASRVPSIAPYIYKDTT